MAHGDLGPRGSLSNHLSLGTDWLIGSRDLESFARGEGWWLVRGRVDVAAAYRNPDIPPQISEGRHRRSAELLERAEGRLDAATAMKLLRDHGAGQEAPAADATHEEERFFTLCMHSEPVGTTTASMIAELPEDRGAPWPVWISFGTPCTGIFVPDIPILRRGWAPLEEKIEIERADAERAARSALLEGDADAAADLLSTSMNRVVGEVLDTAEVLRANLEG